MRAFAQLHEDIDTTTATNLKVAAMVRYFRSAEPADAAWALFILSGRRLKRFIGQAKLWGWLIEASGLPAWLIEDTYGDVGDLAEVIALLMESPEQTSTVTEDVSLAEWIESRLLTLRDRDELEQRDAVIAWWRTLPYRECFLLNKLLTGELRVGVSQTLATRGVAAAFGLPPVEVSRRMMGDWNPTASFWHQLIAAERTEDDPAAPYPFFLASPLEDPVATLGAVADWLAEWKWDGIRAQVVRRASRCFIWSRGEELVTERFPEIEQAAMALPNGTVLDGELLAWSDGRPLPFAELQQRIGRKKLTPAILSKVPAHYLVYDVLEWRGDDIRDWPLAERRAQLEHIVSELPPHAQAIISLSRRIEASSWEALAELRVGSRLRGVEGLMLKQLRSPYAAGRKRGTWWKWKIDPYTFDAVLICAQPGNGRRSNLFTDYTFGVWQNDELMPVAKAYSGLTDDEIAAVDRWVRAHTTERFGPVRAVEPTQVFELAFEAIAESKRHKSGIAVRFPRIARWRRDKPAREADTLENLHAVLEESRRRDTSLR
ncbi:MAG TPA: ATP-dependent DNA ligase [Steroidobacteraceae bacterium]|nr:ATP-dependent DNA ligase [Steroidobacteraceae bacterium]